MTYNALQRHHFAGTPKNVNYRHLGTHIFDYTTIERIKHLYIVYYSYGSLCYKTIDWNHFS